MISVAIILERAWFFWSLRDDLDVLAKELRTALDDSIETAKKRMDASPSAEAAVVSAGLVMAHRGAHAAEEAMGGALALQALALADQVAVAAGAGDQLVAADQGGDGDPGDHRARRRVHQPQQQPGGAGARVREINVRIGVVDRQPVHLAQHPVGQDAVQVQRDDDRHRRARQSADRRQQRALRVQLAVRRHGAVQGDIDRVRAGQRGADRIQQLGLEPGPAGGGQQPGAAGAGASSCSCFSLGKPSLPACSPNC